MGIVTLGLFFKELRETLLGIIEFFVLLLNMRKVRIQPYWDFFIQGFRTKEIFIDYYWIKMSTFRKRREMGKVLYIYYKHHRSTKRGYGWERRYVLTQEVIDWLGYKWKIKDNETKDIEMKADKHKSADWMGRLHSFRPEVYSRIRQEILPIILATVEEYWNWNDKKIAEGILTLNENESKRKKKTLWQHYEWQWPWDDR